MKKIGKITVLFFLIVALVSCSGVLRGQYTPPIPAKNFFEAKFKIHICGEEEFQEIIKFYYGRKIPEIVALTIIKETGEKIIFIQKKQDGTIDLDDLGHEIFYHVINNDQHPYP